MSDRIGWCLSFGGIRACVLRLLGERRCNLRSAATQFAVSVFSVRDCSQAGEHRKRETEREPYLEFRIARHSHLQTNSRPPMRGGDLA